MRVLVIDDDPHIRSGLRRLLAMKYRAYVAEAAHGVVGCQHLLEHACDLVLLDLHMRAMDGMDTLKAIRRSPKHGSLPVLMLTGDSDESVVAGAVALGVAALIIVMSVMNGFRAELFDKIVGLNGHAVIQGYDGKLPDWQRIAAQARTLPGVVSATPMI